MGQISDIASSVFRDWETQGVPSSGAHEPDKAETRDLFSLIDDQISQILSGLSIGDMVIYPSVLDMEDDFDNQDPGQYALIVSSDVDKLKIYVRGSTEWEFVTTLSAADVANTEQVITWGFFGVVEFDQNGILGQVRTIYLPRNYYYKRDGVEYSITNAGTESTRYPGKTEIQYPAGATLYALYIDTEDNVSPFKLQAYGSTSLSRSERYIPVLTFSSGVVQFSNVRYQDLEGVEKTVYLNYPIVVDNATVFVPDGFVGSDSVANFTDRIFYKEMAFTSDGSGKQLCWNHANFLNNLDPWVVTGYPRNPQSAAVTPILRSFNGSYIPLSGVDVVGEVTGGTIRNQAVTGKSNPELCDIKIPTNVLSDITESNLLALGFTKGYASPTGSFNHYGVLLSDNAPGRWAFVRIYVQTDTDNSFGSVTGFFTTPTLSGNSSFSLVREKTLSARAAIFCGWAKMPSTTLYTGIWVGSVSGGSVNVIVCGLQIGYGSSSRSWVRRGDYPTADQSVDKKLMNVIGSTEVSPEPSLLYPDDMWMIENRNRSFYPTCIVEQRQEGDTLRFALSTRKGSDRYPFADVRGDSSVELSPSRLGSSIRVLARRTLSSAKADRYYKDIGVHIAPAASLSGQTVRPLYIGDSITEISGRTAAMVRKLTSLSMTVVPVGTVDVVETGESGTTKAEGRSSRRYDEYTGEDQSRTAPITPGNESTYLALSTASKREYNPFLRASTGGDPSEYIFGGYIFDLSFYLTRFSLNTPTHIIINLGTNDFNQLGPVDGAASVDAGIRCLVARIRATHPILPIAFSINQQPRTPSGDAFWIQRQTINIKTHFETLEDIADSNCYVLPGYAHISPDDGWPFPTPTTDPITGQKKTTITDGLHYEGIATEQMAELESAWIACITAGV